MKPPEKRTVYLETVVGVAAYGPGLAVVTLLDGALPSTALLTVAVYPVLFFAVFQRMPEFLGRRPWRYSPPNAIGLFAASATYWLGMDAASTFAVAIPLLIAGQTVSQLWWSAASGRDVASAPA